MAIIVFYLDHKRKKWVENDEWLEKNRQEIMNSVLDSDRISMFYRKTTAMEEKEALNARTLSSIFDEDMEQERRTKAELLANQNSSN